jgi:uncharacterized membrane protein
MAFCVHCGTQIADNVAFCPNCGKPVGQPVTGTTADQPVSQPAAMASYQPPPSTPPSLQPQPTYQPQPAAASAPLEENIAGMLAYITIIPAIIFLVVEPYNRNRFVRFHSFQNLLFHVAMIVLGVALGIASAVLHFIPMIGWIVVVLLVPLCWLGVFVVWLLLLIKAYQHQMFKLPVIGDMAEKQANV